jgi:hypothetical protein
MKDGSERRSGAVPCFGDEGYAASSGRFMNNRAKSEKHETGVACASITGDAQQNHPASGS